MHAVLRHIVSKFHRPSSYNLKDVEHYVDEQTSRQTDRQAGRKRILRAVKKAEQWRAEREGGVQGGERGGVALVKRQWGKLSAINNAYAA